jgi:acyl-CoA synthetase (NDP forming)
VSRHLAAHPEGGWLSPGEVADVLTAFGIPQVATTPAADAEAFIAAFAGAGRPVAVKVVADDVLHKAAAGGVKLGLDNAEAVAGAVAELTDRFGRRLRGLLVQPMAAPGSELLIGVTGDPAFGLLVTVGVGGTLTDLVSDRAHRLVPLTAADADELLDGFHAASALLGEDHRQSRRRSAVRDVVLRVGRLAELVPEITELDLNPVIVSDEGCVVVDARIRVGAQVLRESELRVLQP